MKSGKGAAHAPGFAAFRQGGARSLRSRGCRFGAPRSGMAQMAGRAAGEACRAAGLSAGCAGTQTAAPDIPAPRRGITQWVMVMVTATVLLWPAPSVTVTAKLSSPTKARDRLVPAGAVRIQTQRAVEGQQRDFGFQPVDSLQREFDGFAVGRLKRQFGGQTPPIRRPTARSSRPASRRRHRGRYLCTRRIRRRCNPSTRRWRPECRPDNRR